MNYDESIFFVVVVVLEPLTKQVGGCDDHHCWDINQRAQSSSL